MSVTRAEILALPKVELHVHLEGTFTPDRVAQLASLHDETPPRPIDGLFDVDNLAEFLETLDWVCALVRDETTAEAVGYDFASYAHGQGIVYAEAIANPTHWPGLTTPDLFASFARGFDRAEADGLGDFRLLPSILRQQSEAEALALVDWIGRSGIDRIVGLSIDGNEAAAGRTGPRFAPAYAAAAELGLGRTAHAGESSGPEGVVDAVELLGVSRIDHGVRCIEDGDALGLVRDRGITLNVCLTSNCTLLYDDIAEHPIADLVAAGVRCTINTDDPAMLGIDLCGELKLAAARLDWSLPEVVAAQRLAIDAAFCSTEDKARLHALLDDAHRGPSRR